jgi:hypothetical protein
MNDLFRFVALRAPERTTPKNVTDLSTDSKFQLALAGIHTAPPAPPAPPARPPRGGTATPAGPLVRLRAAVARALVPPTMGVVTLAAPDPVAKARQIVEAYVRGDYGPGFITDTYVLPFHDAFDQLYAAAKTATKRSAVATAIKSAFGKTAANLVADATYTTLVRNVHDTIVAVFIHPAAHSLPIADLARIARLMNLVARVAADDASLDDPGEIQSALTATLLLPPSVFPLRDDLPQPVGVGDLLVVKQQLKRYEPGDVANIENILRGESRKKLTKHILTTDTTVTTTTSKTTETTNSLDVTERFELKN